MLKLFAVAGFIVGGAIGYAADCATEIYILCRDANCDTRDTLTVDACKPVIIRSLDAGVSDGGR